MASLTISVPKFNIILILNTCDSVIEKALYRRIESYFIDIFINIKLSDLNIGQKPFLYHNRFDKS